jgi:hypothetical protein
MVRYARSHNKSQAARHFGCCWATIHAAAKRVEAYESTGDIAALQNKPRGKTNRTPTEIEDQVVAIYQESFEPPRPKNRRYSAPKVARLLNERSQQELSRYTAWRILCRRGVWEPLATEKVAIQRFERDAPNQLWQIDLIEREPTAIGEVYGVPIVDDHSRYLTGLRFFLHKRAETTLFTTYLAMSENGTPEEMLCDRGGQFVDPSKAGVTQFQVMLDALGIPLHIAYRAQTKGKEERANQFIERDFLDQVRWQIRNLDDLNRKAEAWRHWYNTMHLHEGIQCTPASRYRPGLKVDDTLLRRLFAVEERRKVTRESTVRYRNRQFSVPEKYIGWNVWVANFFDQHIEIRAEQKTIGAFHL